MSSLRELSERTRESLVALGACTDAVSNRWCRADMVAFKLACTTPDARARLEQLEAHGLAELVPSGGMPRGASGIRRWRLSDDGRQILAELARQRGHVPAGEGGNDAAA